MLPVPVDQVGGFGRRCATSFRGNREESSPSRPTATQLRCHQILDGPKHIDGKRTLHLEIKLIHRT